jgi:hypothetical protein
LINAGYFTSADLPAAFQQQLSSNGSSSDANAASSSDIMAEDEGIPLDADGQPINLNEAFQTWLQQQASGQGGDDDMDDPDTE